MCGRSSSTRSVSVRIVRAAPASASARWARASSSPTWTVSQGRPWSSSGRRRCARVSAARASSGLASWSATRAVATCAIALARVVAQARLLDERLRRTCALPCLAPGSLLGGEERELCLRRDDDVHGADGQPLLDGRREVLRRAIESRRAARGRCREREARPASTHSRGRAASAPDRRRRAPARHRRASCTPAAWRPRARSWRCHPRAGSSRLPRRRDASHRSASAGRPVSARTQAPYDGECGVPHQLVIAEPPQPLLQGLHPAVVVHRQRKGVDQAGDGVGLTRGVPVDDRRFGQVVGDAPGHRPSG